MSATAACQSSGFNADDFATFFVRKVAGSRAAIASSPPADIRHRNTVDFSTLEPVTVTEVEKLIAAMPAKSCQHDPIPTWLAKQLQHVLAPIIMTLCNVSFQSATRPASQKQAVVLPRLKKATLDPNNLSYYYYYYY